jgi:hypothetical protein
MIGLNSEVMKMYKISVVKSDTKNKYGSVPGLSDEELADPETILRQVLIEEWKPILSLPIRKQHRFIRPNLDEHGHYDWGAFGTHDFAEVRGEVDKTGYKVDQLREELRHAAIMYEVVENRIPKLVRLQILRYLDLGWLDLDDIDDPNMYAIARWHLRIRRLRGQINSLWASNRARGVRAFS